AAPLALRAHLRARARLGARAATRRAGRGRRHAERHLRALHGLVEADRDRRFQVATALGTRTLRAARPTAARAAAPEQVGQDVLEPAEVGCGEAARAAGAAGAGAAHAEDPAAVVLLALLGIADDVVGRLDLLEALLGARVVGVAVGVVP